MLTSSPYGKVMSTLWRVIDVARNANNSFLNQIYAWESDNYTEFSKMVQDKVVGTQLEAAHVYDLNTGEADGNNDLQLSSEECLKLEAKL